MLPNVNWRLYAFVRVAISFILGLVTAQAYYDGSRLALVIALIITISGIFIRLLFSKWHLSSSIIVLICFFLLGWGRLVVCHHPQSDLILLGSNIETIHWTGVVLDYPKSNQRTKLTVKVESACVENRCWDVNERILVYFPRGDSICKSILPGEKITNFG